MPYDRENNYKLLMLDLSKDNTVIAATGTDTTIIQPSKGFVYELINISVDIPDPVGSTSGTHNLNITPTNFTDSNTAYIRITSNTGSTIRINRTGFTGTAEYPSDATDQYRLMYDGKITASYDEPVDIIYNNVTDAAQSGTRLIEILVKVYREAV